MKNAALAITIPCYNEYTRLPLGEFRTFLQARRDVVLCLVDDASTDRTIERMEALKESFPEQIRILRHSRNQGKAAAVRSGILYCHQEQVAPHLAYLDADLATSLEECHSLLAFLEDREFVFASRILRVGSVVERRFTRFLAGRAIATLISNILGLKVYDTQCGCKVFGARLAPLLFGQPFRSRWLFDVEIFSRMLAAYGHEKALSKMEEIPVRRWVDRGDSKVKLTYFFGLWKDLWVIRKQHRRAMAAAQHSS